MASLTGSDGVASGFTPNTSFGVWGDSGSTGPFGQGGNGVIASSKLGSGTASFTLSASNRAAGVFGQGPTVGVAGYVQGANTAPGGKVGVYGSGSAGGGLGGTGVWGESDSGDGVLGESTSGVGVRAFSSSAAGVLAISATNTGVVGISNGTGILGWGGSNAGLFIGSVDITGALSKGGGGFKIDHPLDPKNQYLSHSFVESPEMKNLYDGIAVCDRKGEAVVKLPDWFEALNGDIRYQLTAIGAPGPNLFIARELKKNSFTIGGGTRGLKVSWQVTGVRRDVWANANRIKVEVRKKGDEKGRYLHPEAHGKKPGQGIHRHHHEAASLHLGRKRSR